MLPKHDPTKSLVPKQPLVRAHQRPRRHRLNPTADPVTRPPLDRATDWRQRLLQSCPTQSTSLPAPARQQPLKSNHLAFAESTEPDPEPWAGSGMLAQRAQPSESRSPSGGPPPQTPMTSLLHHLHATIMTTTPDSRHQTDTSDSQVGQSPSAKSQPAS